MPLRPPKTNGKVAATERNKASQKVFLKAKLVEKETQRMNADHTALEMQLNKSFLTKIQQGGNKESTELG